MSAPDEKVPTEVASMPFSWGMQSETAKYYGNFDTEIQAACQTLKEQSYKSIYGSCNSGKMIGLEDSQYKLAGPSSSQSIYTDNFSDATGFNRLKLQKQTGADGNTESLSELNRDAIGGLSGKGSPLAKSGKQLGQRMVKALSAQPYHPVFPVTQGVSSSSSSSQHVVSSSGEAKYIGNSGQEMQVACQIAEEASHRALYGSKNPYQSTGLGDPSDKIISPSSFKGVNTGSITSTLSGMNLPTNSAKENTEYNQLKLQKHIDGYQMFESGSGLNRDDVGDITVTGFPQNVQVGQNMIKSLSAEPYHPVFSVSHGTSASSSSQHPNVVRQLLEHPECHPRIHRTHPSLEPTIKTASTSMTPHGKEPCYQENSCLADSSASVHGMDDVGDSNPAMSLLHCTSVSTRDVENKSSSLGDRVHADVSEIYSTLDHQTAANSMHLQYAPQVVRQPSQQSLHADVTETNAAFGHQSAAVNIQRQVAPQVSRQALHRSLYESSNSSLPTGPDGDSQMELFRPSPSHRISTNAISDELPRINLQSETMMGKADFNQQNLQRQIALHENTKSHSFGTYAELPGTYSFLCQQSSESSQLNSAAVKCSPGSGSSSTRVGQQAEQSTLMGPSHPFNTVSGGSSALLGSPLSSISRGSSSRGNPNHEGTVFSSIYQSGGYNTNSTLPLRMQAHAREAYATSALPQATRRNHQVNFDSEERRSQCVQERGLDGTINSNMLTAQLHIQRQVQRQLQRQVQRQLQRQVQRQLQRQVQRQHQRQLQRHHERAVASETHPFYGNDEASVRRDPTEEFLEIVKYHEAFFLSFYHPAHIPAHVMNTVDQCYGVDMEREMPHPESHPTPCCGTPKLAHKNDTSGFERSDVDLTHTPDSKRLNNGELNALLSRRKFSSLNKGNYQLFHIEDHVHQCSIDQCGSRFIQQKLPTATPDEKLMVFKEIMPHFVELVTDVFGNYVLQKMIEHGAPFQRREITACLFGSVLSLSCHLYGCRVVQRALELGDLDQKIQIAKELNNNIMKCIHDPNANHVVQKCIEHVPPRFIQFVESMYGHVVELSVHPYGCRVIQRVLEYFDDSSIQEIFLEEIIGEVYYMAKDQYANYVVQNILQHGKALVRSAIIKKFIGRVVAMSKQKFASNVIEKCLTFGSYDEKQKIINEVIGTTDLITSGETEALMVMVNDQYANYVVQKVIETCDEWQRKLILGRLRSHHSQLHNRTYARHVLARLERLIEIGERKMANPRRARRHGKDPVLPQQPRNELE